MDYTKKTLSPKTRFGITKPNTSELYRKVRARKEWMEETDENDVHHYQGLGGMSNNQKNEPKKNFMTTTISAASKKKILVERNVVSSPGSSGTLFHRTPEMKPITGLDHSQVWFDSDPLNFVAYDPVTNYTSPRPEFLRYDPNRRAEILQRIERGLENEKGPGLESPVESSASSETTFQEGELQESKDGHFDSEDQDVEEKMEKPRCFGTTWKSLLLLAVLLYIFSDMPAMDNTSIGCVQECSNLGDSLSGNMTGSNMVSRDKLAAFLGLSEMCLNINNTGLMCGSADNDIYSELLVSFDHTGKEELEAKEAQDGGLKFYSEGIDSNSPISDDPSRLVSLDKIKSYHGAKLIAGKEKDMLLKDVILSSGEFGDIFLQGNSKEEAIAKEGILDAVLLQEQNASIKFSHMSKDGNMSEESLLHQDAELAILGSFEAMTMPVDEHGMVTEEPTNSFGVPHLQLGSIVPSDDGNKEDHESLNSCSEIKFSFDLFHCLIYNGLHQPLHLLFSLSVILLGALGGLYKYIRDGHQKSSPALPPTSESVVFEKEINVANSANVEMRSDSIFPNVNCLPLRHSLDELKEYGIRPPTVELLAEFSVAEKTISETGVGQNFTKRGSKKLQLSPVRKGGSVMKNPPPLSKPSGAVELGLSRSFTTPEKLLKKEDTGDKRDAVNEFINPLRRSSRIRNRITSP